ncbi:MAG TPA: DUF1592 domain-containing protein [Alphaproteobacteria bacterium]|nr:DUF1592 domain-containing protein [Alphaproteobacteria bacterium]
MNRRSKPLVLCGVAVITVALAGCGPREPDNPGGPAMVQRLTESQYRNIIADVFGSDIRVVGRFEPIVRKEGLIEVGTNGATVTPAGFEQLDSMARNIAAQVFEPGRRDRTVPCKPKAPNEPDDACAAQTLAKYGRLLFRRPLTTAQLKARVSVARDAATASGSFYSGLQLALATELEMPEFVFRVDMVEPDPNHPGKVTLDAFSKASRLSFLLWNTAPDDELLTAAERGELNTRRGLARQVDRLLASPRLDAGVRAFFVDMLAFDGFDTLAKDSKIYPEFNPTVAADAQEQTLKTISDLLLAQKGDYRDLFTTRKTFLDRALGPIYYVPVPPKHGWIPYEFPKGDPRAGLLSQISFASLYAHPGQSSPTLRGKAVREVFLCQKVPAPPANVNFAVAQDTSNPEFRTARARLTAHRTNPTCAGCHRIMDPIGLALENFDGIGAYRTDENGVPIDASGELDGARFANPQELGRALHDNPATASCLVDTVYKYGSGRAPDKSQREWLRWLDERFASESYRLPALLRTLALSDGFYAVSGSGGFDSARSAASSGSKSPEG